jgi:hypothetical protein
VRDAKASVGLSKTRSAVLAVCDAATATGLGFATNGDLSVRLAGTAAGEGRQATDGAYGRDATVMNETLARCAKVLATQSAKAGSLLVQTLAPCITTCAPETTAKVDAAFTKAITTVSRSCTPADSISLVGTDVATYLATIRTGAQRVVNAFHPGFNPARSVVSPTPSTILSPGSLPANVDVVSLVGAVPHAGYVIDVSVAGLTSSFDSATNHFTRTISVRRRRCPPEGDRPVSLRSHTTLGTISTTANLHFNLASLAPSVVINAPTSGTITPAGSITISGQVLGNLSPGRRVDGRRERHVVQSQHGCVLDVGVARADGQRHRRDGAVDRARRPTPTRRRHEGRRARLGLRVPTGNFNRLNNSGFVHVQSVIESKLDPAFAPRSSSGCPSADTRSWFSTGTKSATVVGGSAHTVATTISINNLHLDADAGQRLHRALRRRERHHQRTGRSAPDAMGDLSASVDPMNVQVTFGRLRLGVGRIICSIGSFFTDARAES